MAKRPAVYRPRAVPREITYRPEVHDELFLAREDWTRPRKLRVAQHARGLTLDAKFTDAGTGVIYALRTRIRRYADGSAAITEQTLNVRFGFRSEGGAE